MSEIVANGKGGANAGPELLKKQSGRHPFALLIIACLFVHAVFNMPGNPLVSAESVFFIIGVGAAALLGYVYYTGRSVCRPAFSPVRAGAVLVLSILVTAGSLFSGNPIIYLSVFGLIMLAAIAGYLTVNKKMTAERLIAILFAAGFILRAAYIVYTLVTARQHDVWYFDNDRYDIGHAGYIEYYYNNMRLPDFDPRKVWQYYHPPLHHITAAIWLKINTFLGMDYGRAVESVQALTLFYSSACMITVYKLLKALNFKGFALVVSSAVIAFHPTFIILSGSVNNDILSILLAFGALLAVIRWYKDPGLKKILIVALCIGGAMMAKLSAALIAPPVAIVFLLTFVKDIKNWKRYILQFAVFGVVCIPLGLWWQIYNYVKYGMPISYVPLLGAGDKNQYIGFRSVFERLFDFNPPQLKTVFMGWGKQNGAAFYEYNMFTALLKTSVFGEFTLFYISPEALAEASPVQILRNNIGIVLSYSLFFSNLLLVVLSLYGGAVTLFKRASALCAAMKLLFVSIFVIVLLSYVQFCFSYPHTCTQNIRYAVPLIPTCAVFIAGLLSVPENGASLKNQRILKWVSGSVVSLFCLLSAAVYLLLGFSV